jgi:hypothetical protein
VTTDEEPIAPLRREPRGGGDADSRLRSVFLQHRLIAGLPAIPGVPPTTAKFVVEQIVERLLLVAGGLEPLMLLQRDEDLLARGTVEAVLAVVLARAAGWPEERLPDLGAAALLRDLGRVLDEGSPREAGFAWLLERGHDDFWLRCALAARQGRGPLPDGEPALGSVAVVRLAAAVADLASQRTGASLAAALREHVDTAVLPRPLTELACRVFASA